MHKKKQHRKVLVVKLETIRYLTLDQLRVVGGGVETPESYAPDCGNSK